LTVRFNVIKTDWRFGEISDDYQADFNNNIVQAAAKLVLNYLPLRSGGMTRRPSTELLTEWQASAFDNAKFVPFFKPNGNFVIIVLKQNGSNIDVSSINLDTGVLTVEGVLDFDHNGADATTLACVQAGDSLFITGASTSDLPVRVRFDADTNSFKLEGNLTSDDGSLDWFRQLNGLWGLDKNVSDTTLNAVDDSGAILDEEIFSSPSRLLIGSNTALLSSAADHVTGTLTASFAGPTFAGSQINMHVFDATPFNFPPIQFEGATVIGWHQNRLVFANLQHAPSPDKPTFIMMSQSGNPFVIWAANSTLAITDDSPINIDVFVKQGPQIDWMLSVQNTLFVGFGENIIAFPQLPITPTSVVPTAAISANVNPAIDPIQDSERLIYVGANAGAIWGVLFDDLLRSYIPTEMTQFAHHLTRGVNQLAISYPDPDDPVKRIFCSKDDNTIIVGSAISPDIRVPPAWTRIEFAKMTNQSLEIDQLITISNDLYAAVTRTSDNAKSIIKFKFEEKADFVFDFQEELTGVALTSWTTTNSILTNQEIFVTIFDANGVLINAQTSTVDGVGNFTTTVAGNKVIFGIPFESRLKPFVMQSIDNEGPSDNRKRRVRKIRFFMRDTRLAVVNGSPFFPDVPPTPGGVVPEHTGSFELTGIGWSEEPDVTVESVLGYNVTVLMMSQEIEI